MKLVFKILFYLGLLALVAAIVVFLFFRQEYDRLVENFMNQTADETEISNETLQIAYAFGPDSYEPTLFDPVVRSRLVDVYETLVKTDRNLQPEPGLALSWGRINDTTWEFKLRPDVLFHDGTAFDADDVIDSFNRASDYRESGLRDILNTVESLEKIDNLTIHINTRQPDPLLVNRVSTVFIFPSEKTDFQIPVGTGPYKFISDSNGVFELVRNTEYWGELPHYLKVNVLTIPNRFDRLDLLKSGEVHLLANVPPSFSQELIQHPAITLTSLPSLEVNYLVFNINSELLSDKRIREAISIAFDKRAFAEFSNGYARPSNQFVSPGIFGFNPEIEQKEQNLEKAKELVRSYDPFRRPEITIDMSSGTELIGEYIDDQLDEIGISAEINTMSWDDLRNKIIQRESEMYYLGWRSELGDASTFYENAVYSEGRFNGGDYESKKVDQLIDLSLENLNTEERLTQLHEIMRIIIEEDIIGVPLFEGDIIYGIRAGVHFTPRLDGYIYACEIS
jgi:peptide/nickel transport system substrate-binding protein